MVSHQYGGLTTVVISVLGNIEKGLGSTDGSFGDTGLRQRGAASSFLSNKGFGWLMEVSHDDDEDMKKPLLFVLYCFVHFIVVS